MNMKRILVSLISEHTIPNVLITAHYKPDILWFISTEKSERERRTECIENTLRLKGLLPPAQGVEKIIVDQDSLTDCDQKIKSLIGRIDSEVEYILNMTGGNKVMAIAAYETFKASGQKITICYVPLGRNEFIQIIPEIKPLKSCEIKERLNLEEYLSSYGFRIKNKAKLEEKKSASLSNRETTYWLMDNYEQIKGVLGFFYKHLKDKRKENNYQLSATFDRDLVSIERKMLVTYGFEIKDRLISKNLAKGEMAYLTGGWFEEYVFNEVFDLVHEGILGDAMPGIEIENLGKVPNEFDIAFVRKNIFYYIECKTLLVSNTQKSKQVACPTCGRTQDDFGEKDIVRDEVYKKRAISTSLGKCETMICTTLNQISESILTRAQDYGIEILTIEQVRNLKDRLKERFR
ncbi:MAG: hypothetical protein CV087_18930 [Candidatus Brocadia sp. WS118]|nr:MAG: hypothetical protein CV087_18930 [Candidatus Brocadia sp. WS118]